MSSSPIPFSKDNKERNRELENTIGNLYVAEYQLHRLRERLKNHLERNTTFTYKHDNKWYKVTTSVEEFDPEAEQQKKEPVHEPVESERAHGFAPTYTDWDEVNVGVP